MKAQPEARITALRAGAGLSSAPSCGNDRPLAGRANSSPQLGAPLTWTSQEGTVLLMKRGPYLICCVVCSNDSDEGGRLPFKSHRLPGPARANTTVRLVTRCSRPADSGATSMADGIVHEGGLPAWGACVVERVGAVGWVAAERQEHMVSHSGQHLAIPETGT